MRKSFTGLSVWKEKQAALAVLLSLTTYLYNSPPNLGFGFEEETPLVVTPSGGLRGLYQRSRDDRVYASFLGIPYAQPPIGELRFERPVAAKPWVGVRDAKSDAPECLQIEAMVTARVQGDEDCLYLNVFVPKLPHSKPLPVMVFFHGGLFISGGAKMYSGKFFMDENVALVVPQYRLGALGFLSTGDSALRGNAGLWDQNLALKWVQQNIGAFGGDPSQVTIFGNSAGGSSVHFHILSPYSRGLFHKGLSESGTALKVWTLSKYPKLQATKFSAKLNCARNSSVEMVDCLKGLRGEEIVKLHIATMSPIRENTELFVPTIDGDFIPGDPLELMKSGEFNKVPWLSGVNRGEGLLNTGRVLADPHLYYNFNKEWNLWLPLMLDYEVGKLGASEAIRARYFGRFTGDHYAEDVNNFTAIYSERVYFVANQKAALLHAKYAPTYLYYYTYPGAFSFFTFFKAVFPRAGDLLPPELWIAADIVKDVVGWLSWGSRWEGVNCKFTCRVLKYVRKLNPHTVPCHADELLLLFNMNRALEVTKRSGDYEMSVALVKAWADFAKLNVEENEMFYQDVAWERVNCSGAEGGGGVPYMVLDLHPHQVKDPFKEAIQFWDSLNL